MKQFIFIYKEQIFLTGAERKFVAIDTAVVCDVLARCPDDVQHPEFLRLQILLVGYVPGTKQTLTDQT